jgi:metallophosphoesterase (TIGR00282 family)
MSVITVAFLGDIFGAPGRMVVQQQLPNLRANHNPDVVIANAENSKAGSGLTPELYYKIRGYGIDAITLGDHVYRDRTIISLLEAPGEPIARPANLASKAPGRLWIHLTPTSSRPRSVYVMTVLGRIFINLPADDPFATMDRLLMELPETHPIVIVEAHMEATSEKAALAHYLDGRVALVLGTHTHVPTADARVLPKGTGFITDVGMCGPYNSIIGRDPEGVIRHMTTGVHVPYQVGTGGEALCGVLATIDDHTGRTLQIKPLRYDADYALPPFKTR